MKIHTSLFAAAVAVLFSAAPAVAMPSTTTSQPGTAPSCIERTHGNEKACYVGKGNAAKLPYEPANVPASTSEDGNLPHRPPTRFCAGPTAVVGTMRG